MRRTFWTRLAVSVLVGMGLLVGATATRAMDPMVPDDERPSVLSFGSESCPLCIREAQVFEGLQAKLAARVRLRELHVDENLDLASHYGVILIPTLVFVDAHGVEKLRKVGFVDEPRLLAELKRLGWLGE